MTDNYIIRGDGADRPVPDIVGVAEIAAIYKVDRTAVRRWINKGLLVPCIRLECGPVFWTHDVRTLLLVAGDPPADR